MSDIAMPLRRDGNNSFAVYGANLLSVGLPDAHVKSSMISIHYAHFRFDAIKEWFHFGYSINSDMFAKTHHVT